MTTDRGAPVRPIVVDLGALIKVNSCDEILLDGLRARPADVLALPTGFLMGRRPIVKAVLAGRSHVNVEDWPIRQDFVEYLRDQFGAGRKIVLSTSAGQAVAEAIVGRFPFFSEAIVLGANGGTGGEATAKRLLERFPDGFIYAGRSADDLAVWRLGCGSILVDASEGVLQRARRLSEPLAIFHRPGNLLTVFRRSLRLHQWAKNALVFVPLVLGGKLTDLAAWLNAFQGFVAIGFVASATYIINDLWDLPHDRRHWSKRTRPLASGELSIRSGVSLALIGLVAGFALVALAGLKALAMLALYVTLSLSYSLSWKRVPILDVFALASLFTMRLGFGIVLTDVRLSPWLLVFSMFVFLSLSLAKRHTELLRSLEFKQHEAFGRAYVIADAPLTLGMGIASMLGAVLIMILYLIEDAIPRGVYANPVWLWAFPPFLFLFLGRIWLLSQRGILHDDPVAFALKDRPSLLLGLLMSMFLAFALIKFGA